MSLPISMDVFRENGSLILQHLQAVADTAERLIIQYESDRA
jgi:hypothetical protein